ncbi:MAG: succinate--CoA ligase subunit alpha [Bacteroidia bacterium]|nr:succinate--CoA ligase subunit alpha [Bacteroidia bacterium]
MSILVNKNTRLIVQGITGRDGGFHTSKMKAYGTNIVGGVSPGKGGQTVEGIPVFNTVEDAVKATQANTSIIFVPASVAADSILEAAEAGIGLVITITEGIPTLDMVRVMPYLKKKGTKLIGPNCPGLITPDEALVGILPGTIFKKGNVGLISRSGTLTYEMVNQLTTNGIGQSTCVGIGGDPVAGLYYQDLLELYQNDPETEAVVLIGEIGGDAEEQAAAFIKNKMTKPVVAFIAGQSAPPGKRMGHAGAIISSGSGTAAEKIATFEAAGVPVARKPEDIPVLVKRALQYG